MSETPDEDMIVLTTEDKVFVVPDGVHQIEVTVVAGAGGGASDGTPGEPGGIVTQIVDVTPGQEIPVQIGKGGKGAPPFGKDGADGSMILRLIRSKPL